MGSRRRAPEDAGLLFSQAKWGCQQGRMETGGQGHLGEEAGEYVTTAAANGLPEYPLLLPGAEA